MLVDYSENEQNRVFAETIKNKRRNREWDKRKWVCLFARKINEIPNDYEGFSERIPDGIFCNTLKIKRNDRS